MGNAPGKQETQVQFVSMARSETFIQKLFFGTTNLGVPVACSRSGCTQLGGQGT